jgi:tetratricopeptide (TPR) repeat protein
VIDPSYLQAYLGRAVVYERLRDYNRALNDYNNALQINPNSIVARNNRGIALTIIGDYATAAADFDRALSVNANYWAALNNHSIIYGLTGNYDSAISLINDGIHRSGADAALAEARDPKRDPKKTVVVNATGMRLYALRAILETARSLDSFRSYIDLADASDQFADQRVAEAAGSLESRLTFDLRLDDGSWMIRSDFTSES